jgi:hypothetical protein
VPKFLEDKLKKQYGNNKHAIFGTMNKIGAMHGSKITPKGMRMEMKHETKIKGLGGTEVKAPKDHKKKKEKSFARALIGKE